MKREIKFRAWDHNNNEIIFPSVFCVIDGESVFKLDPHQVDDNYYKLNDDGRFSIMQYTGLKDEKGKEIWEDDIVEAHLNVKGEKSDLKFKAKIIYNSNIGAFQIAYKNIDDRFVSDDIWLKYFLTVIGNIHQNPELLNSNK